MSKSEYYTILTKIGIAKFIAARASGNGVNLKSFKLSSRVILPNEEMQSLEDIVYEANINSKSIDEKNPNYVNLMCHVPSNIGGFEVNAIGIYDEEGDLLAVGNTPRTYKPLLEQGSAKELMIKIVMELSNASEVILKLDPSVIMASRDYVDAIKLELELRIEALMQKYDAEFKKVWNEFAKYVTLATDQNVNGVKNFTKLPTSNLQANKDNEFVNLATLKAQAPNLTGGLGVGQSYNDYTSSRFANVTYTNTTKKPILCVLNISDKSGKRPVNIYINGSLAIFYKDFGLESESSMFVFIVPAGANYNVTTTNNINFWSELR